MNPNFDAAIKSPYFEPFRNNTTLDVIVLTNQFDEFLFKQVGDYQGKTFVNIESAYEEIQKDLGTRQEEEV